MKDFLKFMWTILVGGFIALGAGIVCVGLYFIGAWAFGASAVFGILFSAFLAGCFGGFLWWVEN